MNRVNASVVLLVIAIVIFVIAALLAFGIVSGGASLVGLVALGLIFFAAAHLPV